MSTTTLKLIALVFMIIDHIAEFLPGIPTWFHWIGRLSAPIFFFCMAWGFHYTHNRKIYLTRLYILGIIISVINTVLNNTRKPSYPVLIENNIFTTLFISCLIIYIIDTFKKRKEKKYICFLVIYQIISTYIIYWIGLNNIPIDFFISVLGNMFFCEGGFPFVTLGIILYYTKHTKMKLITSYTSFCLLYIVFYVTNIVARILLKLEPILPEKIFNVIWTLPQLFGINVIPIYHIRFFEVINYYWMVIFALPFMLLYNHKKGRGIKYLFYFIYPFHIYLLYFIGSIMYKINYLH